jgi:hypothetical protein
VTYCVQELFAELLQSRRIGFGQSKTPFDDFSKPHVQDFLGHSLVRGSSALAMLLAIHDIRYPENTTSFINTARHRALVGFGRVDSRTGKSPIKTGDGPSEAVPGAPGPEGCGLVGVFVTNENSVQPTSHAIPRDEPQSRSSLQPSLSLANEIRRGTGVQGSTVRTLISKPQEGQHATW